MYLRDIGLECVDWIQLAQDSVQRWALVNKVHETLRSIKGGEVLD